MYCKVESVRGEGYNVGSAQVCQSRSTAEPVSNVVEVQVENVEVQNPR